MARCDLPSINVVCFVATDKLNVSDQICIISKRAHQCAKQQRRDQTSLCRTNSAQRFSSDRPKVKLSHSPSRSADLTLIHLQYWTYSVFLQLLHRCKQLCNPLSTLFHSVPNIINVISV